MRLLVTCCAGLGHVNPMIPFAGAARDAGHDVVFAAAPEMQERLRAAGLKAREAGMGHDHPEAMELFRSGKLREKGSANLLFGMLARHMLADLPAIVREHRPDVVLSEVTELAGPLLAERAGVRRAVFGFAGIGGASGFLEKFGVALAEVRDSVGLSGDAATHLREEATWIFGGARSLLDFETELPRHVIFCKPASDDRVRDVPAPEFMSALEPSGCIYVTLGTELASIAPNLFETVLDGMETLSENIVVTTGPRRDPASLGARPPHMLIERYVPQAFVLPHARAVVCHAGYGTTMATLAAGVPMVLIPGGADQPMNAASCERVGVAIVLDRDALTPHVIREAVRRVLDEPGYAACARRISREMAALPDAAGVIEALC